MKFVAYVIAIVGVVVSSTTDFAGNYLIGAFLVGIALAFMYEAGRNDNE